MAAPGSTVGDLEQLFEKAKGARQHLEPDWFLNLAYFVGNQWTFWNGGRVDRPRLADWRVMIVDNRILPAVTSRVARKTKTKPIFVCTPATADESDINAAKIGEKVLDNDWFKLHLQRKLFEALLWADVCSAGFWKIYWDKTQGERQDFVLGPDGAPMIGDDGRPLRADQLGELPEGLSVKTVAAGDVCVDVLSPFELFPDPMAHGLDEAEWVIECKVRSVEYVRERYGKDLPPDADAPIGVSESRLSPAAFYSDSTALYRGVKVYEYWHKPGSEHPHGKRICWGGEQILAEYDAEENPYVMFGGTRVPGRFWPTSIVTQLRSPQTELNKLRSQIVENANRLGNPALLKSRQANVKYTGLPGEQIEFDDTVPNATPSYLSPPEMPVYFQHEVERIERSIQEISGMHEVSNAKVPAGVTAASAINLLQEADDTRLGPEVYGMEDALARAGTTILKLRARYNDDPRLIQIAGEDGDWDIFEFKGTMLADNQNVEVQAGSALPQSKAAKMATMQELLNLIFQYGVQVDPRDLRRFFKDYQIGGLERLFSGLSQDELQINDENRRMAQGEMLPLNSYDNDPIHIQGHQEYQKTSRYRRLPPESQAIFEMHVTQHQERYTAQVEMQMAQQAAMAQAEKAPPEGGPGQTGQVSPGPNKSRPTRTSGS